MSTYHEPVLAKEVVDGMRIVPGHRYIDATLGGAGHTKEILKRGGEVFGMDTDRDAVVQAKKELEPHTHWRVVQGNFRDIKRIAQENGFEHVDGIMFDLGVSSHQLDTAERGFSYRFLNAPLDLRLDQDAGTSAAEYIQTVQEGALYEVLATFGEEERAGAIAHAICRSRSVKPIQTTGDLVLIISTLVPERELNGTLSRVFQALRIVVNDEKNSLLSGLEGARELLTSGGRLAVISFHSLEDRQVKQFMTRQPDMRMVTKKPIVASYTEQQKNRRARSAKLRIAEKL